MDSSDADVSGGTIYVLFKPNYTALGKYMTSASQCAINIQLLKNEEIRNFNEPFTTTVTLGTNANTALHLMSDIPTISTKAATSTYNAAKQDYDITYGDRLYVRVYSPEAKVYICIGDDKDNFYPKPGTQNGSCTMFYDPTPTTDFDQYVYFDDFMN